MPQTFHVAGMNCVQPIAPAFEGPMLQPWPDSISVMPARIDQRRPNARAAAFQVGTSCADPWQRGSAFSPVVIDGTPPSRAFDVRASRPKTPPATGLIAEPPGLLNA